MNEHLLRFSVCLMKHIKEDKSKRKLIRDLVQQFRMNLYFLKTEQ